jgi:diguanylate cyclase (GGDEF)-like protein
MTGHTERSVLSMTGLTERGPEGDPDTADGLRRAVAAGAVLSAGALDRLMPLHLIVGPDGRITGAGPTLRKIIARCDAAGTDRAPLIGQDFFHLFDVRRPGGLCRAADLAAHAGERLTVFARNSGGPGFRGVALPVGTGGLILNLSFGIGVIDAVRDHGLTDADFAITDLAMELLYLVEAKSAVMEELRDLNERLQGAKRTAEVQALTDTLTGLRNRRALDLTLADLVDRGQSFGLMHIDLDYFKAVNDTLGHAAGDHVLRQVAAVLLDETRKGDLVARVGGDEFVVVFPLLHDAEALGRIAGRMVERLSAPIDFEGQSCLISASIGVAVSTSYDVLTADRILNDADEALYASKHAGRGRALFHTPTRKDHGVPDRRQAQQI